MNTTAAGLAAATPAIVYRGVGCGQASAYWCQCVPSALVNSRADDVTQTERPKTARPVNGLTFTALTGVQAARPTGLVNSSAVVPPVDTTAYAVRALAASASMVPPSETCRHCAPPSRVNHNVGPAGRYSQPSARVAPGPFTTARGACMMCQLAPPSVVKRSRAWQACSAWQLTAPSATPQDGEMKLTAAGWKPAVAPAARATPGSPSATSAHAIVARRAGRTLSTLTRIPSARNTPAW